MIMIILVVVINYLKLSCVKLFLLYPIFCHLLFLSLLVKSYNDPVPSNVMIDYVINLLIHLNIHYHYIRLMHMKV